jgi:hypothetical protein
MTIVLVGIGSPAYFCLTLFIFGNLNSDEKKSGSG